MSAAVRLVPIAPVLEPIPRLPPDGIDWVIVGGEDRASPAERPHTRGPFSASVGPDATTMLPIACGQPRSAPPGPIRIYSR